MPDPLNVNVHEINAGKLFKEGDKYIFSYTQDCDNYISLTMPVRKEQYINKNLHPIFEMHLPEGYLLSIIKKHFSKITKTDDFGLLHLMSSSINGRITYGSSNNNNKKSLNIEDLLNPSSDNLFEELVSKFALNSALSGVQPKVLVSLEDRVTLKHDDYIVKSWGDEYPQLALNEYLCMSIVKYAGIVVPEFYISKDDKLFIMKRFDILEDGTKLGFEDMCVLQAKQREEKYEGTYEQVVKTIKTFVSSEHKKESLKQFFKMIVVNNIIQNGDAHLKNFGLIYTDVKDVQLSPAYDVVSTTAYIKNDIPALNLLGSKKWWDEKYIKRFGIESCSLTKLQVNQLYEECIVAAKKVLVEIEERLLIETNESKTKLLKHIMSRLSKLTTESSFDGKRT